MRARESNQLHGATKMAEALCGSVIVVAVVVLPVREHLEVLHQCLVGHVRRGHLRRRHADKTQQIRHSGSG